MLFILAVGDRRRASSRLRVWDHLEALEGIASPMRADCVVPSGLVGRRAALALRLLSRAPLWLWWFIRARVVYIQETLVLWPLVSIASWLGGKRIIFDFSDPVDSIGHGLTRTLRRFAFDRMIQGADHVVVENRRYQRELPRADVVQFYGPVNVARYQAGSAAAPQRHPEAPVRVGWTGSPGTLHFIAPLFPHLDAMAAELNIELTLIGVTEVNYSFRHLPITCLPWSEELEFAEVPKFDLGLHSLDKSDLALKRGAGKIFIYMAAGVPYITDARGIGANVVEESGAGIAVAADADWPERLRYILTDDQARRVYAARGVEFATAQMSYDVFRKLLQRLMCETRTRDRA